MTDPPSDTLELRLVAKVQNGILAQLVDKHGSIAAAADVIGIAPATLGNWLAFRSRLRTGHHSGGSSHARKRKIVLALERETGRNIRDIFPDLTNDEMRKLSEVKTRDVSIERKRLTDSVERKHLAYDSPQEAIASQNELTEALHEILKALPYRERGVLEMRFGLNGHTASTLEETAHVFKVKPERIRQIEAKAIRRLQQPSNSEHLVGFLD